MDFQLTGLEACKEPIEDQSLISPEHLSVPLPAREQISLLLGSDVQRYPMQRLTTDGHEYREGKKKVTLLRIVDAYATPEQIQFEHALRLKRISEEEELHESLLVHALLKQYDIAKLFGLDPNCLIRYLKLDYNMNGQGLVLMDNFSTVYMGVLDRYVTDMRKRGMSNNDIAIELAGHVFHESVHDPDAEMKKKLLGGGESLGEITTVTAQLAYYLFEKHEDTGAYSTDQRQEATTWIKRGENSLSHYELATFVSWTLLHRRLKEYFPQYASALTTKDVRTACQKIRLQIPDVERDTLLQALKKAIADAANSACVQSIVDHLR